jgi:hypothetical protein
LETEFFSLQIDTTQEINVHDQCSVVIYYVIENKIHERLISLINCDSNKGKLLSNYFCKGLNILKINVLKCIGTSTDGAANMQRQYNGFISWLNKEVGGDLLIVLCYAHVLNLLIADVILQFIYLEC